MQHATLLRIAAAQLSALFATALCAAAPPPSGFHPEFVAIELTTPVVRPGDPICYTLKFRNRGTQASDKAYRVFTHFETPKKSCTNIAIHADHVPAVSTTQWAPAQLVVDGPYSITVPKNAAEGEYFIHIGLYDYGDTGKRVLDKYAEQTLHVSSTAPPASELGPKRLVLNEVVKRRMALKNRFSSSKNGQLDTQHWRFSIDERSGAWSLLDKATNVLWTSSAQHTRFGQVMLSNGRQHAIWNINRLARTISTPRSLQLSARPTVDGQPVGIDMVFTIAPAGDVGALELAYTSHATGAWHVTSVRLLDDAFHVTEEDEGRYYIPYRLGIELPADQSLPSNQVFTTYNNLSMAMCGATKQGSALLVSWSEVDSHLTVHTRWPDSPLIAGRRTRSISLELDGAANACLVQPLGKGDYVEIAKAYRAIARSAGWLRTWADKRLNYPTVDRLFGAADFKPFVFTRILPSSRFSRSPREQIDVKFTFDEVAQCAEHWRNDLDIDRAFVVLAGWINGGYDVRHPDVLPPAPECGGEEELARAAKRIRDCGYLFGLHDNYQDMYEDAPSWDRKWLNKDIHGRARKGGNWYGGQAWQVCAIKQVELAARKDTNLPAIAKLFQPSIYFIDTVFAWPLVTCEDPAHPMMRRDDLAWKTKLCLLAKQHFGLFGSEEGREWAVPCADYLEGIFGHQTDSAPGDVIPLFPLVYSNCVQIMTHQGNRIGVGDEKKVTDHILFAEMFLPKFGNHRYWEVPTDDTIPIVPLEPVVKLIAPKRLEITYRWKALKPLKDDFGIFVHFIHPGSAHAEGIVFQNDHHPTIPTSQWQPGQTIEDGPFQLDVPDGLTGSVQIAVGMLRGGNRIRLQHSTHDRRRYRVGAISFGKDGITFTRPDSRAWNYLWSRADNGWGEALCETDRVIKNVWEVLSPLNRITAQSPLDEHRFLTPDRLVQQTRFADTTITVAYDKAAQLGDNRVPPYGFVIEGPRFIAFCALRYNGLDYATPTLFTARSLDGKPLRESRRVRVYHGFGDMRLRLFDKEFEVRRQRIVSMR